MNIEELKDMSIDKLEDKLKQKKQSATKEINEIETEIINKKLKHCAEVCERIIDNKDFDKLDYIAQEINKCIEQDIASCYFLRHNALFINDKIYEDESGFGKNAMLLIKTYEWTFLWDFVEFFKSESKSRTYFFENKTAEYICDFVENLK